MKYKTNNMEHFQAIQLIREYQYAANKTIINRNDKRHIYITHVIAAPFNYDFLKLSQVYKLFIENNEEYVLNNQGENFDIYFIQISEGELHESVNLNDAKEYYDIETTYFDQLEFRKIEYNKAAINLGQIDKMAGEENGFTSLNYVSALQTGTKLMNEKLNEINVFQKYMNENKIDGNTIIVSPIK